MADLATRQIGTLSGGQRQRVILARALAQQADLVILDEPFAGIDAATEATLVGVLTSLRDAEVAVLAVHHDLTTVTRRFDRAILLNCRVIAAGPTDKVVTPAQIAMTYGGPVAALAVAAE